MLMSHIGQKKKAPSSLTARKKGKRKKGTIKPGRAARDLPRRASNFLKEDDSNPGRKKGKNKD